MIVFMYWNACLNQQVQWLLPLLSLVLVLIQFIWMRLDAVVVKVTSLTAHEASLSAVMRPTDIEIGGAGATVSIH